MLFKGVRSRYPYYSQRGSSPKKYFVWWNHDNDIEFPWDITTNRGDAPSAFEELGPDFPCPNFLEKFKLGSVARDVSISCISHCSSNPPTLSGSTNNWDGFRRTTGTIVTYKCNSNGATQFSFCSISGSWTSLESCSSLPTPDLPTPANCGGSTEPPLPLSCDSDGGKVLLTPTDRCKVICSDGYEQGLNYQTNRKPTSWTVAFPKVH